MAEIVVDYDPAEDLDSPDAISVFVNEALKSEDAAYIVHALGVVASAKGMPGISVEALLSSKGTPTLETTLALIRALGISLTAEVMS